MISSTFRILLSLFIIVPVLSASASDEVDTSSPEQVITIFQKLPPYEMFCKDETRRGTEAIKVGAKFESYLSKELNKLFMWSQCGQAKIPPRYTELSNMFFWDVRFGFKNSGLTNCCR